MADDVPVCDVLLEAMEYLSKLGSNLKTRSETLKEKRIRKDKLKNTHAVQKAASKVLLICELSKKSLVNVETGIRKILSIVEASQAKESVGAKTSTSEKPEFKYFNYKSRTLRVNKHVFIKHYTSVKVLAKRLPTSMQDIYPVYYDCKLFRKRRRYNLKRDEQTAKRSVNVNSKQDNLVDEDKKSHAKDETAQQENDFLFGTFHKVCSKDSERDSKSSISNNINKKSEQQLSDTIAVNGKNASNATSSEQVADDISMKKKDTTKISDEKEPDSMQLLSEPEDVKSRKLDKKRNYSSECRRLSESKSMEVEDITAKDKDSHKVKTPKKKKHARVIDDSSNSDDNESTNQSLREHVNEKLRCTTPSKSQNKAIDSESDGDEKNTTETNETTKDEEKNVIEENENVTEKIEEEHKQDDDSRKPLIKCVNLTKLLKPDVLKTIQPPSHATDKTKKKYKGTIDLTSTEKKIDKHNENKQVDEEFWALKRSEVKAFKPKDFSINITRLPELSVDFLANNNIKKIRHKGTVVCEVSNNKSNSSEDLSMQSTSKKETESVAASEKKDEESIPATIIAKVKNALLNDSDSDKSDLERSSTEQGQRSPVESLAYESENVKNSLLESESDEQEKNAEVEHSRNTESEKNENNGHKLDKESENSTSHHKSLEKSKDLNGAENVGENNYDKEVKSQEQPDDFENQEIIDGEKESDKNQSELPRKSELQSNSEKTPEKQLSKKSGKTNKSNSQTPLSKRKHIMESMHAKKMLLTYSSSSESEDEQLKNVIKEIKDSLLKEVDSEEKMNLKESFRRKSHSSSESDEDDLVRRKKRKILSTPSPSLEKDQEDKDKGDTSKGPCDSEGVKDNISMDEHSNSSRTKMGRSRENASASSSHNSDSQDDKDIDSLTNIESLNKARRRRDENSVKASTSTKGSKKMLTSPPLITGEGLLEAAITSDEGSSDNEVVEEELPAVPLSGLNGSGVEHLAKDDLLVESDSSSDNNKEEEEEEVKNDDDSDTEENLKTRRRKANAISSDSEAGASRRKEKDRDVRISDFDDSGDESGEASKKRKKKKGSDSDGSAGSSNEGGKKKRRRIKQIDSDDGSGSDTENEGRNKHGRKNIRKVMGKNQLEEATKKAARQEKERMARIAERQKLYNSLAFDESGKPDEVVLDKVVLDFDPDTKEPLIEVDRGLVKKLKPHQANGIKFMWDACFESVKRIKKDKGSGCILAHCMGLGKTLQVVTLTHTLLTHSSLTKVNRVLVVCPLSTVLNWVSEFRMWLKHAERDFDVDVYELSRYKQNSERAFQLSQWYEGGGVCVLGYEMFRNLSADNNKKFKKKMLRNFQESLVDPGPDLVVCDEGHLLKNEKTSLSQSMNRVKTLRRIVLTGTPLQNNLKEYYCMVQFVKPNLLGKYNEYLNRFVNPITNGQYTDSTEHDIRVMKRRSHVLHKMLDGAVQRRDYGVLAPFLPPKHEYVLFITLTDVQVKLYQHYLDNFSRRPLAGKSSGFLFPDFQSLQRIWTHPLVLKYNSERYEIMQQKKRDKEEEDSEGSLVDFIDDDSTPDETSTEESSDDMSDVSDDSRKKSKKKNKSKKSKGKESKASTRRGTRANPDLDVDEVKDNDIMEVKYENPTEWWIRLVTEEEIDDMRNSHKLVLLFEILRQCEAIGDKLLVFSQSLYSLDLIEHFLGKVDEATQEGRIDEKLGGHVGSWSPGVDYFRLDGSTSCENRSIWCKNFNREDNPRARLFLISTRAGGLGINLVAANRVVIFDVSWNPSHDVQSIFRVYRFGQKKPCYVYRFLAMGTMEEKIYERQVTKQAISKRVIDEQQIDRHYAENDLAELYKFEPRPPAPRPVPLVPKDRFFAEMLKDHEALIYKFHEHDSLLENKEEETLSEEERKAAWDDFENEKNRPPPAPFPAAWPNGMVPNLIAQQQQQLAYAALATMLRKEMPNVNDDQIRNMLPLLYGANPAMFGGYDYGLMQKLGDMYKYAQPGMMNPAMMNMSAAGGAGAMGGGGTSGLQYEPPWQRQQQQQQQMRLQQLMQQQQQQNQSMGAKFYAGGLGSRDPVAMAMQQQRAREIMLGDRARPRGRPPHAPHAPRAPPPPADVVNLDSD